MAITPTDGAHHRATSRLATAGASERVMQLSTRGRGHLLELSRRSLRLNGCSDDQAEVRELRWKGPTSQGGAT